MPKERDGRPGRAQADASVTIGCTNGIARMDRLVVLDRGRIAEQGTHEALLRLDGRYAALWRRQSGGFLDAGDMQAAE
jgi:hypothetical protein